MRLLTFSHSKLSASPSCGGCTQLNRDGSLLMTFGHSKIVDLRNTAQQLNMFADYEEDEDSDLEEEDKYAIIVKPLRRAPLVQRLLRMPLSEQFKGADSSTGSQATPRKSVTFGADTFIKSSPSDDTYTERGRVGAVDELVMRPADTASGASDRSQTVSQDDKEGSGQMSEGFHDDEGDDPPDTMSLSSDSGLKGADRRRSSLSSESGLDVTGDSSSFSDTVSARGDDPGTEGFHDADGSYTTERDRSSLSSDSEHLMPTASGPQLRTAENRRLSSLSSDSGPEPGDNRSLSSSSDSDTVLSAPHDAGHDAGTEQAREGGVHDAAGSHTTEKRRSSLVSDNGHLLPSADPQLHTPETKRLSYSSSVSGAEDAGDSGRPASSSDSAMEIADETPHADTLSDSAPEVADDSRSGLQTAGEQVPMAHNDGAGPDGDTTLATAAAMSTVPDTQRNTAGVIVPIERDDEERYNPHELPNHGNTCFALAGLQLLAIALSHYQGSSADFDVVMDKEAPFKLLGQETSVQSAVVTNSDAHGRFTAIRNLGECILRGTACESFTEHSIAPLYDLEKDADGRVVQYDSSEILNHLFFAHIQDEESVKAGINDEHSVGRFLYFVTEDIMQCDVCYTRRQVNLRWDPYVVVPVKGGTMQQALDAHFTVSGVPEKLDGVFCEECDEKTPQRRWDSKLIASPEVAVVTLKRTQYDGVRAVKVNSLMQLEETVCIGDAIYELVCMVAHQGTAAAYGHYVTYAKLGGLWYKFNNLSSRVTNAGRAELHDFSSATGHLLHLYRRISETGCLEPREDLETDQRQKQLGRTQPSQKRRPRLVKRVAMSRATELGLASPGMRVSRVLQQSVPLTSEDGVDEPQDAWAVFDTWLSSFKDLTIAAPDSATRTLKLLELLKKSQGLPAKAYVDERHALREHAVRALEALSREAEVLFRARAARPPQTIEALDVLAQEPVMLCMKFLVSWTVPFADVAAAKTGVLQQGHQVLTGLADSWCSFVIRRRKLITASSRSEQHLELLLDLYAYTVSRKTLKAVGATPRRDASGVVSSSLTFLKRHLYDQAIRDGDSEMADRNGQLLLAMAAEIGFNFRPDRVGQEAIHTDEGRPRVETCAFFVAIRSQTASMGVSAALIDDFRIEYKPTI
ncbi:hypothetical protein JKP88DRAFT_255610 [Tribonema minus]|uniref:USP domain-containing protein n=1 Tax=Tribonema minus TaxID=303371 RepID=A0A835Z7V1_9STRA|nr:hypothetical protein JKP88DRAFT_255610 [Tribonema minus]